MDLATKAGLIDAPDGTKSDGTKDADGRGSIVLAQSTVTTGVQTLQQNMQVLPDQMTTLSFNGRVRDELLNIEEFGWLLEAQVVVEAWRASTTPTDPTARSAVSPRRSTRRMVHRTPTGTLMAAWSGPPNGVPSMDASWFQSERDRARIGRDAHDAATTRKSVCRASVSKSVSACRIGMPASTATAAIKQSMSLRTVSPARRHERYIVAAWS